MKRKEKWIAWCKENIVYIGSFLLPFLIMTAVCIACKVEPFGDQSLAIIDGLHQYMPFFAEYHEKLRNLDSLFYSWNGGLGHNFLSLWAYYLSSPLNLLLVFLPKSALNMGFSWLVVLKISLTGLTTGAFLIHRSNKKNWKVILFSTAFALSNYMIGYSWNIMWLDAILMFPLILIGFDKMMEEKDGRWYAACLTLAMIGNYYIAFMICIFLVLWFLFYEHKGFKPFLANGIRFAFFSLLGACMSAIVLIPAYSGLMNTASAESMSLPEHSWLTEWMKLIQTHLVGTEPMTNNNFDGNANLYVGMLSFLLLFLYFFGRRIGWRQKLKRGLFLAILFISMNEKILNFIWHGFHDQYGIPNRFAFLYLFLIVLTGFEAMEKLKAMRLRHVILAVVAALWVAVCSVVLTETEVSFALLKEGDVTTISLVLSVGLIVLYGILLLLYSIRKISYKKCVYPLAVLVTIEVISMSFYGFMCNGQIDIPKFYADTEGIEQLTESIPEDELVRSDLVASKMLDEAIWHNLKSVGMFGSTVNGTTVSAMDYLGFYTGANEYLYKGATPLTNVLLNVKYNIRRDDDQNLNGFQIVNMYEDMELLENPFATSIGYGIEGDLEDWNYDSVYPFRVQNRFVEAAYGMGEIFHEIEIPEPEGNDCTVEATGSSGEYRIEYGESYEDNLTFSIPVTEGDDIYLHYDGSRVEKATVSVGDEIRAYRKLNSEVYHVGLIEGESEVTIKLQLKDDDLNSGVIRLSVAAFDNELFEQVHGKMMEQAVDVTSYTSDSLEGTITLEEDGMIFFSIPYDTGWTVLLDGEEAEIFPVVEGFLGVKADADESTVEMHYVSPGFRQGAVLSLIGIILFLIVIVWYRKSQRKLRIENVEVI